MLALEVTSSSTEYIYPTILPWPDIYRDLRQAGCTPYQISIILGRPYSTVQRWFIDGIEPRESIARALLAIHAIYCGSQKTEKHINNAVISI